MGLAEPWVRLVVIRYSSSLVECRFALLGARWRKCRPKYHNRPRAGPHVWSGVGLRRALDIRLRPWAFRPPTGLLPLRWLSPVVTCALLNNGLVSGRFQGVL